jgi:hypothetical protein
MEGATMSKLLIVIGSVVFLVSVFILLMELINLPKGGDE